MKHKHPSLQKGFTLTELMVVFVIITLLLLVILTNIQTARARGRDSQVRSDKQRIVLALVKAREANQNYIYPGSSGWHCLKSAGSCFQSSGGGGGYSGDPAIVAAVASYLPGGNIPLTPASSGSYMYDSYLYNPNVTQTPPDLMVSGITGPVLLWYQEKPIPVSECNGVLLQPNYDPGMYYCFEKLPN